MVCYNITIERGETMKRQVSARRLTVGETYTICNPYHPEYEYGEVQYVGTDVNKYGETVYRFSDGSIFDEREIADGNIRK